MKIKKGNLLTILLAMLCAALIALGVGFALPKNEQISAEASGSSSDIKIVSHKAYYYSNGSTAATNIGAMSSTSPFSSSVSATPASLTFGMAAGTGSQAFRAVYVEFKVGVTVPAWEEWEISYRVNFTCKATLNPGVNQSSGLYYFYPNPTSNTYDTSYGNATFTNLSNMAISRHTSPGASDNQYYCIGKQNMDSDYTHEASINSGYNTSSSTIKLTNNSSSSKQFTFSYAAGYNCGNGGAGRILQLDITLSNQIQKSKELFVTAPGDVELDYTGNDLRQSAVALINKSSWYKRTDAIDNYNHVAGEWASYTLPANDVIDVIKNGSVLGGYDVTYSLTDASNHPFKLANGTFTTQDQNFKIKVKPIDPPDLTSYLSVNAAGTTLFAGQQLNTVTIGWDPHANIPAALASGTVAWYSPNNKLSSGTNSYRYTFTSNSDNYNSVDDRNYSLSAGAVVFDDIDVTYTQGNSKVFPSITLNDGTSLPGTLSVIKKDTAGGSMGSVALSQCTLSVVPGTTLTGGSTGSIRVTYTENNKTVYKDITVNVSVPQLVSITASQKPNTTVTESTTMAQLAQMLEVKATFEDGQTKTLAFTDYDVKSTLAVSSSCLVEVEVKDAGDNSVSNWQNATSGKCSTTVEVVASNLLDLTAQWTGGVQPSPVYDRTPLNDIKPYLTVTAVYDDGGSKTLSDAEYTLTGNLITIADGGSAVLKAEYGGKNAPIQLDNIIKAQLEYVKVSYFDDTQTVFDTDNAAIIGTNGMVIVKAKYAQFADEFIVTADCTFTGDLVASDTDKSVIHVFFDGNEIDYDTYEYDGGLGVWVEADNVTLLSKPTANTMFTYSGAEQTILINNFDSAYMTLTGGVNQTAVGNYTITISLNDPASYRWDDRSKDDIVIEWEIKQLVLNPVVEEKAYSGNEYTLKSVLNLTDAQWNFITASGELKKTDAGEYSAMLTIKPEHFGNVVWVAQNILPAKKPVKLALTAVSESADYTVDWKITPAVIAATWDDSKTVPMLNLTSASVENVPSDLIVYTFTDVETGQTVSSNKLEKGHDYIVTASINTNDPRANNYVLTAQPYELSIAAAQPSFLQKIAGYMTQTYFGLPLWCWLLIGLALIILLIIIIVVAKKRAKTKEEREAKKAAKEEEKQRREEERRMQQEKLEAERELARAKQEAEIEKIKAQAQAGLAGAGVAGMASMAMAQPAQQQMAVADANAELMREMREQMAEMRAENRAAQAQLQAMQYQPPVYQPQYQQPAPVQAAPAASSDIMTLMDLKLQISELKTAQAQAEKNNQQQQPNFGYMGMGMGYGMPVMTPYGMQAIPAQPQVMTPYGMLPAYGYAPMTMLPQTSQPVQTVKKEEEEQPAPVQQTAPSMTMSQPPYCPPGAVMTTTTTIDTSKTMDSKSKTTETESNGTRSSDVRRRSEDTVDDLTFDVDGFYDPLD